MPKDAEQIFHTAVDEKLKTYRVFISHAWTHNEDYYRLTKMLDEAPNFSWQNYSVPEHDPLHRKTKEELIQALNNQIGPTNVVIVLAGMYVLYREWILREIDIAVKMNKPIIGVKPWGSERIPQDVQDVAKEIVGWNTLSITNAIKRWSL